MYNHLISKEGKWNNIVLLKTPPKESKLNFKKNKKAQKNHAYAFHIRRAWYNGSYPMMTKPMKTLELHYPMSQLLIIIHIPTQP